MTDLIRVAIYEQIFILMNVRIRSQIMFRTNISGIYDLIENIYNGMWHDFGKNLYHFING